MNRYIYAADNPVSLTDPSGRCLGPAVAICVLGVADWIAAGGLAALGTSIWMSEHQVGQAVAANIERITADGVSGTGASPADAGGFGDPNEKDPRRSYFDPRGIYASVNDDGILEMAVETTPGGPSGTAMFDDAMRAFGPGVRAIRGNWGGAPMGDNLASFNAGIQNGLAPEEAALNTWTGKQAARYGFTRVQIETTMGSAGEYTHVTVLFTP